jgi:hypothetical protein
MLLPAFFVPEMEVGVGGSGALTIERLAFNLGVMMVYAIPVRFLATWLFNSARNSVVIVAVFHAAMNATQSDLSKLVPGYNSFYLIGAFAVVSVLLVAVTRGKLGYAGEQGSAPFEGSTGQGVADAATTLQPAR